MTTATFTTVNELSAAWALLVWRAAWQGGMALLLVLVLSRAVRTIPPRVKCWLWRLAFIKLLIAGLWIRTWEVCCLPPSAPSPPAAFDFSNQETSDQIDAAQSAIPLSLGLSAPRAENVRELSVASWALAAWVLGVTLSLAKLLTQWVQARQMISRLAKVSDERVLDRLVESCRQMSVHRLPGLRVSRKSEGPFLLGILRPTIVLPSIVVASCSADQLNAVLIHELAHIRRRDLLWNCLPALAEVLFFFHPLIWIAKREWRLTQEIATDELALCRSRMNVSQYAGSLVDLVAKCSEHPCPPLAVAVSEAYFQLSRRMIAMQNFRRISLLGRLVIGTSVLAVAVVGVVPWRLTHRDAQAQSPRSTDSDPVETAIATPQNDEETTRTIAIHVVGPDGNPMEGVHVFRNHVYTLTGADKPKIENKDYQTDAAGRAVVELSGASVDLRLWAQKEKFVSLHAMWAKTFQSDGDRIPAEFFFQLQSGTRIGGIVKNERGQPIEGVRVEVIDQTAGHGAGTGVEPGKRPVRAYSLAEGEQVVTDADGRWQLDNVPPEKDLVFDDDTQESTPDLKIALRFRHPDYVANDQWGRLQREQGVTHESLRDQTAVIVMKRKQPNQLFR